MKAGLWVEALALCVGPPGSPVLLIWSPRLSRETAFPRFSHTLKATEAERSPQTRLGKQAPEQRSQPQDGGHGEQVSRH